MLSQEFKSTVADNNLLRTRIMLKDSFVIDTTFKQLTEMLNYARPKMPGLIVPFEGEFPENDPSKWDRNVLNLELVQLVNNFSERRIEHLKQVVSKVLTNRAPQQNNLGRYNRTRTSAAGEHYSTYASHPKPIANGCNEALRKIEQETRSIGRLVKEIRDAQKCTLDQANRLQDAANELRKNVLIFTRGQSKQNGG